MLLCGRAKANVLQLCQLVGGVAALLVLLKRWLVYSFILSVVDGLNGLHSITGNVSSSKNQLFVLIFD
ncbi:MAG TPA: hypothetical protein DDX39_04640 [Bacteroidales bacterium]|nr:MAG: hypothetical protein A2W98_01840 [Bacteroidetes bacterium GWF2_33_38]OFY73761.1 MAG: hypothetical protein A2265_10375 [Bacteroidetes bacterium RIFOXYA12_FULL_33_9]OFY89884.1 MAG: hypothetical protein A2236_07240 [Bacteroidetes bacterium RIFOXYA2_FULL_33_7]HBF87912.1 hypothetical protein [Bacteroidales bacterium]